MCSSDLAGGGGGSSYIGGVVGGTTTQGVQNGNGSGTISWNIVTVGCPSALTPVTVTINPLPVITTSGTTICSGQTATLSATASVPGGTFTWSPGNINGSSITVSPNATTQYTVTYNVAGCAAVTANATVTVNAIPSAPIASGVTLCGPGVATLTASGANSYLWYTNANGTGLVGNTSNTYTTPNLQTTTTYYVQGVSAQNCNSALTPVTVTVNPVPVVTVTNATVCAGQQATLTATSTVPGGTFTWSPGGATGATLTVTPNTTTTYTATYSVAGCPSVTGSGTVTVNPLQGITGTLSACLGQTSQLSNVVTPGTWSSSSVGVATISAGGLVTGISAGTSTITYNASNGCSTTAQFTVYPQPVLTVTPSNVLCFGGTGSVTLTASGGNAPYTYGGSPTTNLSPGTYTYTATSTNGCVSAPVSITITQPANALSLTTTQVNVGCFGNSTGSVNLTVSGGTAPYTYLWNTGGTVEDPTGMPAGNYNVTVTDANGCTAQTSVTITQPQASLALSTTQVNVLCFGNSTEIGRAHV